MILFAVQQKLTQQCKATILQLKNKYFFFKAGKNFRINFYTTLELNEKFTVTMGRLNKERSYSIFIKKTKNKKHCDILIYLLTIHPHPPPTHHRISSNEDGGPDSWYGLLVSKGAMLILFSRNCCCVI